MRAQWGLGQTAALLAEVPRCTTSVLRLPAKDHGMVLACTFLHADVTAVLLHLILSGHLTKLFAFQLRFMLFPGNIWEIMIIDSFQIVILLPRRLPLLNLVHWP